MILPPAGFPIESFPRTPEDRSSTKIAKTKSARQSPTPLSEEIKPRRVNEPLTSELNGERVNLLQPVRGGAENEALPENWVSQMIARFTQFFDARESTKTASHQIEKFNACCIENDEKIPLSSEDLKWIVSDEEAAFILEMQKKSSQPNPAFSFAERYKINRLHDKYFGKNQLLDTRLGGRLLIQKMWPDNLKFQQVAGNMLKDSKGRECLVKLYQAYKREGAWGRLSKMIEEYSRPLAVSNRQSQKTMLDSFVENKLLKEKDRKLLLKFQRNEEPLAPPELRRLEKISYKIPKSTAMEFKEYNDYLIDLKQIYSVLEPMEFQQKERTVSVLTAFRDKGKLSQKNLDKLKYLVNIHRPEQLTLKDKHDLKKLVGKLKPLYAEFMGATHQKDLIDIRNKIEAWSITLPARMAFEQFSPIKKERDMIRTLVSIGTRQEGNIFTRMYSKKILSRDELDLIKKINDGDSLQVVSEQELEKMKQLSSKIITPMYEFLTSAQPSKKEMNKFIKLGILSKSEINALRQSGRLPPLEESKPESLSEPATINPPFPELRPMDLPKELSPSSPRTVDLESREALKKRFEELSRPKYEIGYKGEKYSALNLMKGHHRISSDEIEMVEKFQKGEILSADEEKTLFELEERIKQELPPLVKNDLRIGIISSFPPSDLDDLFTSESSPESSSESHFVFQELPEELPSVSPLPEYSSESVSESLPEFASESYLVLEGFAKKLQELSQPYITPQKTMTSVLEVMVQSKRISPDEMKMIRKFKNNELLLEHEQEALVALYNDRLKPFETLIRQLHYLDLQKEYHEEMGVTEAAAGQTVSLPSASLEVDARIDVWIDHEIPVRKGLQIQMSNVFELLASHGKLTPEEKAFVDRLTEKGGWLSLSPADKEILKGIYHRNSLDQLYQILVSEQSLEEQSEQISYLVDGGYFEKEEVDLLRESFRPVRASVFEQMEAKLESGEVGLRGLVDALENVRESLDRALGKEPSADEEHYAIHFSERFQGMIEKLCHMNDAELEVVFENPEAWYAEEIEALESIRSQMDSVADELEERFQEFSQPQITTRDGKTSSVLELMVQGKQISTEQMAVINKFKNYEDLTLNDEKMLLDINQGRLKPFEVLMRQFQYLDLQIPLSQAVSQPSTSLGVDARIDELIDHEIPVRKGEEIQMRHVFELLASHGKLTAEEKTFVEGKEGKWQSLSLQDKEILKGIYERHPLDQLYQILTSKQSLEEQSETTKSLIESGYFERGELELLRESFRPARTSIFEQMEEKFKAGEVDLRRVADMLKSSRRSDLGPSADEDEHPAQLSKNVQRALEKLCTLSDEEFEAVLKNPKGWYEDQLGR